VTWSRTDATTAVVNALMVVAGETVFVFPKPPQTINPPALVVGRPIEVRYGTFSLGADEADLPVACIGPADGEETVDSLIGMVRQAVAADRSLGGVVQDCTDTLERNWHNLNVAGVDILQAEILLTIRM